MSKQIQIPDIGSDEVTVTEVMVKVGDTIAVVQSIINNWHNLFTNIFIFQERI